MNLESSCKNKPTAGSAAALYIHVPFCRAKCGYCDFYSLVPEAGQAQAFVAAVAHELTARSRCLQRPLASVFVGGGTPTSLPAPLLAKMLGHVSDFIDDRTEFSVEANPGTISARTVEVLLAAGVNRVNIGVQSLDDGELAAVGRIHTADQARAAVDLCRRGGLENIGLDLIYGLPGQTLASWRRSLAGALAMSPAHLSCYGLSYEAATPLAADLAAGRTVAMPEEDQRTCYYAAIDAATAAGLEHYEISNFARPARRCRHNLTCWHNRPYIGVGPAAASYIDAARRTNTADLSAWLKAVTANRPAPATEETLPPRQHMAETVMLSLRLTEGVDRRAFAERFGVDVVEAFGEPINRYQRQGALELSPTHVRLSLWALIVADTVLAGIIASAGTPDGPAGKDSVSIGFADNATIE